MQHVSLSAAVFVYRIDNGQWITVYDNTRQDGKGNTYKSTSIKAGGSRDGKDISGTTWEKAAEQAVRFVKFMSNSGRKNT